MNVRELRNRGGDVLARVAAGEEIVVTRSGEPIAELRPLPRRGPEPITLLERWRHLPPLDLDRLRRDLDTVIDPTL